MARTYWDPEETWELRFTEAEGRSFFNNERPSHPYVPRHPQDVPGSALHDLTDECGIRSLAQVFIIPFAVRSVGGGRRVISPNSVLALGDRAVGLWTEKPAAGVKLLIPLERVAAIEDLTILLYGRLSFVPFGNRLTIRYNTVARAAMRPALLELRRRLAGPARSLPPLPPEPSELPFKWRVLAHDPVVRLEAGLPALVRFAEVPGRSRRERPIGQMIALNAYELVYLSEPLGTADRYGVDCSTVPRSRMTSVSIQDGDLEVISNGASLRFSMAPTLRDAAGVWLGAAAPGTAN